MYGIFWERCLKSMKYIQNRTNWCWVAVYKNVLKTGEQREMYDLGQESMLWYEEDGEHKDVHFEWYGDYMVVWSYNNGDGENLVTIKSLDMTR